MDCNEVISILKDRELLLCDCRERRQKQTLEKERIARESGWSDKEVLEKMYEEALEQVNREEEKIDYVWFFFLQLPRNMHALLDELYVKQTGWEYVMQQFPGSKNKLMERKNKALQLIAEKMNEKGEQA